MEYFDVYLKDVIDDKSILVIFCCAIFFLKYSFFWILSENLGTRMLGEKCESNDQCRRTPVDGTKICSANECQCSSGHIPIDAYRCIRDFGSFI
jgi:hypothetical protein